ncbi:LysR family transcriptional regulator [Paraburkholderia unamae]|uniref:LysR family transcriptional regulator n=1 Tax=Paraburkholderia unamae TaxID=219649 RepID=UPI001CB1570B|nr:LysR family transcriptional regulator [Paraburkholderia unamae]CAG9274601.1 LysR family transcriptional regulator [Paraburkholderia unamae]
MDKLLALRTLLKVADCGGFTAAAQELGKTTSSIARIMDGLEASLGTPLLTRTSRNVSLTDAGCAYVEQVRQVLSDLNDADSSVIDRGTELTGHLRVSVSATYGRLHLATRIPEFLQAYPRITVDLVVSDIHLDLVNDRLDVALRVGVPDLDDRLIVKTLGKSERFLVASPAWLERHGRPATPTDLARAECLQFAYKPGRRQRWNFRSGDAIEPVIVTGQLVTNNLDMIAGAAIGGQGVALLPKWLVAPDVAVGRLVRLFEDREITADAGEAFVYATYLPNRRLSRKVRAFIRFVESFSI